VFICCSNLKLDKRIAVARAGTLESAIDAALAEPLRLRWG
jgi:hypothetical protein